MRRSTVLVLCASAACAQNPVVFQRGVVNAITQAPAPSSVGRGGIVQITGLNLGPAGGLKASGPTLPTRLGDVQVLLNGTAVPLFSADPATIVAQVPVDAPLGPATLVVQRSSGSSLPAGFTILAMDPSVRTANGDGYGQPAGTSSAQSLALSASGLGPTDPPLTTGSAGPPDTPAAPSTPLTAFIGGIRANVTAAASSTRVGEFDVRIDVPAGARPGDLISLIAGNRSANPTVYQPMQAPEVRFLPLPGGAPDLQALTDTDVNGNYLIATGARDTNGCFPAIAFDFLQKTTLAIPDCLTAGGRGDPLVAPRNGDVLGALIGPPQGAPPDGVSSTVEIFGPALASPLSVALPGAALTLVQSAGGDFCAVIPGTPPQAVAIDGQTGATSPGRCDLTGAAAGGAVLIVPGLSVDGLTKALAAPMSVGAGRMAVVVGDDADQPTRAEFAVVNAQGSPVLNKKFPDGWLPLIAPPPQNPGGSAGGAGGLAAALPRGVMFNDGTARLFFVLARTADNSQHGLIAFTTDRADPTVLPFPSGWFAAACSPRIGVADLQLAHGKALFGARDGSLQLRTPCSADGFLQLDLTAQTVTAIPLPSQGQMNAAGALNADVNDYVYGYNPATRGVTDTVYVLDGATGSLLQPALTVPSGIAGFTAPRAIPELNSLIATLANRAAGDSGLILFDLYNWTGTPNILPVPDGFDSVALVDVFLATRKAAAIGIQQGRTGSQLIIYNLDTGDVTVVPNPDGVKFLGSQPAAPRPGGGGPGGGPAPGPGAAVARLLASNTRANTVSAVALDASGKQVGVVVVRIP